MSRALLPIHPVPMRTVFRHCFLVNFAVAPDALAAQLPGHLQPDVHHERAFVSVVIARMERMRPAFLPRALGVTYIQVVYRAVVRCGSERGVFFLRSDADHPLMVLGGNALTFFQFHRARIDWQQDDWEQDAASARFSLAPTNGDAARIEADFDLAAAGIELPASSRFRTLPEAHEALSELFVAFGPRERRGAVEAVRIRRSAWESLVVPDRIGTYEAMSSGLLFCAHEAALDSVFYVESLDYYWNRMCTVDAGRGGQWGLPTGESVAYPRRARAPGAAPR